MNVDSKIQAAIDFLGTELALRAVARAVERKEPGKVLALVDRSRSDAGTEDIMGSTTSVGLAGLAIGVGVTVIILAVTNHSPETTTEVSTGTALILGGAIVGRSELRTTVSSARSIRKAAGDIAECTCPRADESLEAAETLKNIGLGSLAKLNRARQESLPDVEQLEQAAMDLLDEMIDAAKGLGMSEPGFSLQDAYDEASRLAFEAAENGQLPPPGISIADGQALA